MASFLFDLRCAVRAIRKNAFGGPAILALALAIGSNTAMFSVANAMLLRPLPYRDPGRLIALSETNASQGTMRVPASAPTFVAWKTQSRTIDRLAAFRPWGFVLTGAGEPERLPGARASADLFPLLGIEPLAGRTFAAEEDNFGRHHVVLIGEGLWRRRFGADPSVVGRSLILNGERYDVVGVLPEESTLIAADVWVPLALEPFALQQRGTRALTAIGRLKPGVTRMQAQAEMHAIAGELARQFPDPNAGWDVAVVPLSQYLVGDVRPAVLMVWVAVALVLLIACANTANLLIARGGARQHEIAVSVALGASRARLVRRSISESVLLAILGGLAGLPIALIAVRAFVTLAPAGLPRIDSVAIDVVVFAFTFLVSLGTGVLVGLLPALGSLRSHASSALRETAASTLGGGTRSAFRDVALACQVTLAVVVLIGAGLLVRSFGRILAIDLGFQPDRVLTMTVSLPDAQYGDAQRRAIFFEQLVGRVKAIPGVVSAGLVSHLPLSGRRLSVDFAIDGRPLSESPPTLWADCSSASADFFRVMNIPVRRGRVFTAHDAAGSGPVIVINEEMAHRFWPDGNAIGRRLVVGSTSGADRRPREIVGIVGNVRSASLEATPGFQLYIPSAQNPWPTMSLAVRTSGDSTSWAGAIRTQLLELDSDQPVYNIRTLDQVISRAVALRRFQMLVVVLFAVIGLALATIGVYSVVACSVRLRTQEIGLRLALGARRSDILVLVIRSAVAWAGGGIAAGILLALAGARLVRGMLFGVEPADPLTFLAVLFFAASLVLLGSGAAGRRAASVDPLIALRHN